MQNLNELRIPTADSNLGEALNDFSTFEISGADIRVVFRNFDLELERFCAEFPVIIGCVAWLTDEIFIDNLISKKVCILVQKEDFLRPDIGSSKSRLFSAYNKVPSRLQRYELPGISSSLSVGGDPSVEPFRCVGNHNREKSPAFPRMHNKFLIGCSYHDGSEESCWEDAYIRPKSVWTGSYNITRNAQMSFENAVVIRSEAVASAYASEWSQVFALSEPLDWESPWVLPEYRIGT